MCPIKNSKRQFFVDICFSMGRATKLCEPETINMKELCHKDRESQGKDLHVVRFSKINIQNFIK